MILIKTKIIFYINNVILTRLRFKKSANIITVNHSIRIYITIKIHFYQTNRFYGSIHLCLSAIVSNFRMCVDTPVCISLSRQSRDK